jgi:hypothetical protein
MPWERDHLSDAGNWGTLIGYHHALLAAERERGDRLEAALRDRDDLIDYILKNSLGGWGGRTVDEISRWKKARAAMKEGAL